MSLSTNLGWKIFGVSISIKIFYDSYDIYGTYVFNLYQLLGLYLFMCQILIKTKKKVKGKFTYTISHVSTCKSKRAHGFFIWILFGHLLLYGLL